MTLTVFGATGLVGKKVVTLALAKGYTVKAFGRNVESFIDADLDNTHLEAIKGYVFEENDVFNALEQTDGVISVLGGAFDGHDKARSLGIKNIIAQMKKANVTRIVGLGGLGILNADEQTLLIDTPGYPAQYKPVGLEHLQAYNFLKDSHLDWTFVCPPNILDEDAKGSYNTNKDYPPVPNNGSITAIELAAFMLNELDEKKYLQCRVGISN